MGLESWRFGRSTHVATIRAGLAAMVVFVVGMAVGDEPKADPSARQALAELQPYVGSWKGVGQLKRGSTRGSWIETAEGAWDFAKPGAAIVLTATDGKFFDTLRFEPGDADRFVLVGTLPDGETQERYTGQLADDGRLVLKAEIPAPDRPARIAINLVAGGDRLVVLYERLLGQGEQYVRLAEVGFTRQGSSFGKGGGGKECVVTGGLGTIAVEFEGKSYYVCCTGCRDLFNEDPAAALADYRERKQKEKEEEEDGP